MRLATHTQEGKIKRTFRDFPSHHVFFLHALPLQQPLCPPSREGHERGIAQERMRPTLPSVIHFDQAKPARRSRGAGYAAIACREDWKHIVRRKPSLPNFDQSSYKVA